MPHPESHRPSCRHIMRHHAAPHGQRHATPDPRRARPRIAIAMLSAVFATTIGACGDSTGIATTATTSRSTSRATTRAGSLGFTDYPVGKEAEWAIGASLAALPAPLDVSRKGIRLSGENRSDDLFMYVTRGVTGLMPNAQYDVRFRVTLATNAPRNCVGHRRRAGRIGRAEGWCDVRGAGACGRCRAVLSRELRPRLPTRGRA